MGGSGKSKMGSHIEKRGVGVHQVGDEHLGQKGWQKGNLGAGKVQVSLEAAITSGVEYRLTDAGLGLPKVEPSVKKRKSQGSLGQGDPFCRSVPERIEPTSAGSPGEA